MCIIELFKEWGGHFFSILGIIGGIFLYFRHDKKLKRQEMLLNELQIRQFQKADDEDKKARLECSVIKGDKGGRTIRFSNVGHADARNVRIDVLNENDLKGVYIRGKLGPYDLITSRSGFREEKISLDAGHTKTLNLRITWDDDFKRCSRSDCLIFFYTVKWPCPKFWMGLYLSQYMPRKNASVDH